MRAHLAQLLFPWPCMSRVRGKGTFTLNLIFHSAVNGRIPALPNLLMILQTEVFTLNPIFSTDFSIINTIRNKPYGENL